VARHCFSRKELVDRVGCVGNVAAGSSSTADSRRTGREQWGKWCASGMKVRRAADVDMELNARTGSHARGLLSVQYVSGVGHQWRDKRVLIHRRKLRKRDGGVAKKCREARLRQRKGYDGQGLNIESAVVDQLQARPFSRDMDHL
jgi:hypothetical protein